MRLRKYGVEATVDFSVYGITGVDLKTDWVPAVADCEIMKDGGASTQCTNTATDEGSTYSIVLTATEMQAARLVLKVVDAATKVFLDTTVVIETYGHASAQHAFDLDNAEVTTDAASRTASKATGFATPTNITAGTITTVTNLTNAPTNGDLTATMKTSVNTECDTALSDIKLDHLVAVADADDVVDESIIAKLASKAATADWSDFDNTTDALEAISDKLTGALPQAHAATANNETTGSVISGDFSDTASDDDTTYYITAPVGVAVGGFGLNVDLTFGIGTGRILEAVTVNGNFNAGGVRAVDVWGYDYILSAYVQISNSGSNFQNSNNESTHTYPTTENMRNVASGEVKIRFTSDSITTGDRWNCDYVSAQSVAQEAAGLTADTIQQAVWARGDSGHDEDTLGYNLSQTHYVHGDIVSATDATQFVISTGVAVNDMYNGSTIKLEDMTDNHYEERRVLDSIAASNEIIVERAFSFTPTSDDHFYFPSGGYADVNVTHIDEVDASTQITAAVWDSASARTVDFGTLLERLADWHFNEKTVTDSTGAVVLRNKGDSADLADWGITDNATITVSTEVVWA